MENDKRVSFLNDDISFLSVEEKLNILCDTNPIYSIVEKVNCNDPRHYNILLRNIDDEFVKIYNGKDNVSLNTDVALLMFIDHKIENLHTIVNELENYLDEKFVTKIRKYLDGGCNEKPTFRPSKCRPKNILKTGIKIKDIVL